MQTDKNNNKRSVATAQRDRKSGDNPGNTAQNLMSYISKTEIPILAEYAADVGVPEYYLRSLAAVEVEFEYALKILETKKRAALERKIYSGELNATIGTHVLKMWREEPPPKPIAELRTAAPQELWELGLSDWEVEMYGRVQRELIAREKP